jgi:hypothetical protein
MKQHDRRLVGFLLFVNFLASYDNVSFVRPSHRLMLRSRNTPGLRTA